MRRVSSEFGMRRQRRAHDVESVAIAAVLGIEPRQQLAAPRPRSRRRARSWSASRDRRWRRRACMLAERAVAARSRAAAPAPPTRRSPESAAAADRSAARRRCGRGLRRAARSAPRAPARSSGGMPMVSNSWICVGRAGEIADLDRGAACPREHHALQLDRQRADRGIGIAEAFARVGPFALPRIAPTRARAARRADCRPSDCQVLERLVRPPEHDVGDRAQHQRGGVVAVGGSSASATSSTALASAPCRARDRSARDRAAPPAACASGAIAAAWISSDLRAR